MTITAAMTTKQGDLQSQELKPDVSDLWSVMNVYAGNYWFLGVDQATELTESFTDQDGRNEGESFAAEVKVGRAFILKLYSDQISCFLLTRCCPLSGGAGDTGVWPGSSDRPPAAGRVLLQWIRQELVLPAAAEGRNDAGGKNLTHLDRRLYLKVYRRE